MDIAQPSATWGRPAGAGTTLDGTPGKRLSPARRRALAIAQPALVCALAVAALLAVRLTGGSPNPLNHLGYASILLAAYIYGWRGGLLTGAGTSFLLGPMFNLLGATGGVEDVGAWTARGVFFVGVGITTGFLFDRSRAATNGWRRAAGTIASREREAIRALARSAEAKDAGTGEHVGRVQQLSEALALRTGSAPERAADIGWSALLHDVGKLHVPDGLLLKPGPLTGAEWKIMREHPVWGEAILAHGDGFELARRIARWHHENFDGTGYPDRLRNGQIPIEARIVRITDSFDAMTHDRPYRHARTVERALEQLDRFSASQFDPEILTLFIEMLRADPRILRP